MDVTKQDELIALAKEGFESIDALESQRETALANLSRWLTDERFADARPQLEALLEAGRFDPVFDAFFQQIPFGTGGRRGAVGFGTNRIHPFTISTSIQGHCEFLRRLFPDEDLSVVVAFDVRRFEDLRGVYDRGRPNPLLGQTSQDFARVAAQVYAANGIRVWFRDPSAERYVSTPELSFSIRRLGAHGGLNISASHNHPDDNGAKIYNARGGQEIPPLDEEMATIVESIQEARTMPWDDAVDRGLVRWIPAEVHDEYIRLNATRVLGKEHRSAKVAFTPLHGTGWSSVGEALLAAGFDVECFPDQAEPDGAFPNVPLGSPNPEVPQSCSATVGWASERGADVLLAADPDADRLGMLVPSGDGGWTFLNGNQIGTILAAYLLESAATRAKERPFCVTTVVTTSLMRRIAEACGVQCVADLPIGFKYIGEVLRAIEDEGRYGEVRASIADFVVGTEESHGYLVTAEIRDKDAAGAAVLLAELVSRLRTEGRSVLEYLDEIYKRFGYVRNRLVSTVMLGAKGYTDIRKIQDSLRKRPLTVVGDRKVLSFVDRQDESGPYGAVLSETDRAARDLLTLELEGGARIVLRPSGTEPKNKIYVEVGGPALGASASAEELAAEKVRVDALAEEVARDFTLAMLDRVGVSLPRWALAISDLVALNWKQDFAASVLPELIESLGSGKPISELEQWTDRRLASYGKDGRLLVKDAVAEFCAAATLEPVVHDGLTRIFGLTN